MKQFNEYFYKIKPKELCRFFNIKYKLFDKIMIEFGTYYGYDFIKLCFNYKIILLCENSIKRFLTTNGYNRFRINDIGYDNEGIANFIYGVKIEEVK